MSKASDVAGRIREARERTGQTLREAAAKMHVAPSTLMRWEDGTFSPRVKDVPALCAALECPATWLVFGREKGRAA